VVLGLFVEPYSLAKLSAKTQDGDRAISSLSETAARATKYKKDLGFSSHGELDSAEHSGHTGYPLLCLHAADQARWGMAG